VVWCGVVWCGVVWCGVVWKRMPPDKCIVLKELNKYLFNDITIQNS